MKDFAFSYDQQDVLLVVYKGDVCHYCAENKSLSRFEMDCWYHGVYSFYAKYFSLHLFAQ